MEIILWATVLTFVAAIIFVLETYGLLVLAVLLLAYGLGALFTTVIANIRSRQNPEVWKDEGLLLFVVFWPVALPCYIVYRIGCWVYTALYRFLERII